MKRVITDEIKEPSTTQNCGLPAERVPNTSYVTKKIKTSIN